MRKARREIFRTGDAYSAAAARFWQAARRGEDMESVAQVLVGQGLFYHQALVVFLHKARGPEAAFARRRLSSLRARTRRASDCYMVSMRHAADHADKLPAHGAPAPRVAARKLLVHLDLDPGIAGGRKPAA